MGWLFGCVAGYAGAILLYIIRRRAMERPDGAEITLGNLQRAVEIKPDLEYLAPRILTAPASKAYDEARATAIWAQIEAGGLIEEFLELETAGAK